MIDAGSDSHRYRTLRDVLLDFIESIDKIFFLISIVISDTDATMVILQNTIKQLRLIITLRIRTMLFVHLKMAMFLY